MLNAQTVSQLTDFVVDIVLPCAIVSLFEMKLTPEILVSTSQVFVLAIAMPRLVLDLEPVSLLNVGKWRANLREVRHDGDEREFYRHAHRAKSLRSDRAAVRVDQRVAAARFDVVVRVVVVHTKNKTSTGGRSCSIRASFRFLLA